MTGDKDLIARCRQLGVQAREAGECAVGCVIAREGSIVAEACEQVESARDIAGHAEIIAVRRACQVLRVMDLSGCTLYTNVEPCWMCSKIRS